ncbi:MAG TPA: hypothetical protein VGH26_09040 [Gaiellaceae bacterium]
MSYTRRAFPLIAAVVLVCLAVVLGLLALDVRSWQGRMTRDDLRFRAHQSHLGLWRTPTTLPGDPARSLLGIDDAISYRRGLQLFWYSRVGVSTGGQPDFAAERVVTEQKLQSLLQTASTREERSNAANLLGIMTVTAPAADTATELEGLDRARLLFTQAVRENPSNYAAKVNLELVLRIGAPQRVKIDQDARGGFGSGGSSGVGAIGGGY